jgi:predicted signal transduction protein with EAL and GGDEF domain
VAGVLSVQAGLTAPQATAWLCVPVAMFASRSPAGARAAAALAAVVAAAIALLAAGTVRSGALVVTLLLLVAVGETVSHLVRQIRTADRAVLESLRTERSRALDAVAERDALASRLAYQADHDVLTGLPNRSAFLASLGDALAGDRAVGVLFIDLDDFKVVNDTFGHAAGRRAARRGSPSACATPCAPATSWPASAVTSSRCCSPARTAPSWRRCRAPGCWASCAPPFAISAGMASGQASGGLVHERAARPAVEDQAAELMRRADLAMYAAKAPAGGRCVPVPGADAGRHGRPPRPARRPARALIEDELVLHYQPVIDLRTPRMVAVEALARWAAPGQRHIPPSVFIPIAEESGAIVDLGMWVLEQACLDLQLWDELCPDNQVCIAVNVSARQLREPAVGPQVARVLHRMAVDPRRVVLEVTESLLMEDGEAAAATLWQLRGLGIRIAVDDFGTGYSSLSRLVDLPLDDLKIDRAFIAELEHSDAGATIVRAAVAMAHGLGLTVVAEGSRPRTSWPSCPWRTATGLRAHVFSPPGPGGRHRRHAAPRRHRDPPRDDAARPPSRRREHALAPTSTALPAKHTGTAEPPEDEESSCP